jgi:hypothetical protein
VIEITVTTKNVNAVLAALSAHQEMYEKATAYGIAQVALAFEVQAARNFQGTRKRVDTKSNWPKLDPPMHKGPPGGFPNVVSGDLRRSIHTTLKPGFGGKYTATVSPTVLYARAVELGGKNWQGQPWRNGGYPYMGPAYRTVKPKLWTFLCGRRLGGSNNGN